MSVLELDRQRMVGGAKSRESCMLVVGSGL
jgi:hypothetical protein